MIIQLLTLISFNLTPNPFIFRAWSSPRHISWPRAPLSPRCQTSGGWSGRSGPAALWWSLGPLTSSGWCVSSTGPPPRTGRRSMAEWVSPWKLRSSWPTSWSGLTMSDWYCKLTGSQSFIQDNPPEKGWGGAKGDPVPLHWVALSLQPLQQRAAGVQEESETSDESAPGDSGWPSHRPLQVIESTIFLNPIILGAYC